MDTSGNRAFIKQSKTAFLISIITQIAVNTESKFLSLYTSGPKARPMNTLLLILMLFFALPADANQTGCVEGSCANGTGTYMYSTGERYEGEFRNNRRHGRGTMYYPTGGRYVGEYRDGKKNGQGTMYDPTGYRYEGEFKDGKNNGQGTAYYPTGERYEGEFRNDRRHGRGTMYYPTGERYEGEFRNDRRHGRGTMYYLHWQPLCR